MLQPGGKIKIAYNGRLVAVLLASLNKLSSVILKLIAAAANKLEESEQGNKPNFQFSAYCCRRLI